MGEGNKQSFLYGEAPPRGPTPYRTVLYTIFEKVPFRIPFTDKLYPISCPPFNCCKCNVLNMKKTTERFLDLYTTGADY